MNFLGEFGKCAGAGRITGALKRGTYVLLSKNIQSAICINMNEDVLFIGTISLLNLWSCLSWSVSASRISLREGRQPAG